MSICKEVLWVKLGFLKFLKFLVRLIFYQDLGGTFKDRSAFVNILMTLFDKGVFKGLVDTFQRLCFLMRGALFRSRGELFLF